MAQPVQLRLETRAAIAAVESALSIARGRVGAANLTLKGARDIVTETDVAIEDELRLQLAATAATSVIGEERGGLGDSDAHWIVDPLCGTRSYASGIPLYCVNVALVEGGAVTAAVVGDASTGDILIAQSSEGAWAQRGGELHPLRASGESQTIVIETGKATGVRRRHAAAFVAEMTRADRWDLLALSSTLSTAYVAAGRVAAYVQFFATTVHNAAGSLVAQEAGATVSDLDGSPWTLSADCLVASADAALHEQLLARIAATAPN